MQFNLLTHSKCPHCGMHAIPAFSKIYKTGRPAVYCKNCAHAFYVKKAASNILDVAVSAIILCMIFLLRWNPVLSIVLGVLACFLLEYFAPLTEIHDDNTRPL